MKRTIFNGKGQKIFLDLIIERTNSPSLRALLQFGISTNYAQLKNFYTLRRSLPENLFNELCHLGRIDKDSLDYTLIEKHWGQVKGGKISRRTKTLKVKI